MNQRCASLADYFSASRFARLFGRFAKNNLRTVALDRADFHFR
jgi:hypothetical protein